MNIDIDKIIIDKFKYDNSLKKIICDLHYSQKDIIIKLENVNILDIKDNYVSIKNNSEIQFIFSNINEILKNKITCKIDNILNIDFKNEIIDLECLINKDNQNEENKEIYDMLIFVSHLEFINKEISCKLYVIQIL